MTEIRKCPYEKYKEIGPKVSENFTSLVDIKNKLAKENGLMPNLLANTNLFSAISPYEERPFFKKWEPVDFLYQKDGALEIFKAYEQLDQNDLTAYLTLLKLARPNFEAVFTRYEFLKLMGLSDNQQSYGWFNDFLWRAFNSKVCFVKHKTDDRRKLRYWGSMVLEGKTLEEGSKGSVLLSLVLYKPLVALLEEENWSIINMEERLSLRRNQTALSVHAFLSTNKSPKGGLWIKKEHIKNYWGPNYKGIGRFMEKFRSRVIKPLGDIGFIKSFEEKKDAIKLKWKK